MKLDARAPSGPIEQQWAKAKFEMRLVNPANKRKYKVIAFAIAGAFIVIALWAHFAGARS